MHILPETFRQSKGEGCVKLEINIDISSVPDQVALGILAIGIVVLGVVIYFVTKEDESWLWLAIPAIILIVGVACIGAVSGWWELPWLDYFNRPVV